MKQLASLLSIIFHPLLLPTYAVALIITCNPYLFDNLSSPQSFRIIITVFINTFFFPAICILMLKALGYVKTLNMEGKEERYIPYVCCMSFYFWAFIVFKKSGQPTIINTALLGSCITLAAVFFINIFRKISVHTAGMGCLVALMLVIVIFSNYNLTWLMMLSCIAAGLVGSSRLVLKSHDNSEIYLGYFVGFIAQIIAFRFVL